MAAGSSSRPNAQLNLPPAEVRTSEHDRAMFRHSEHADRALPFSESAPAAVSDPEQLAVELLNEAITAAGLDSKEIAHLCGVSVSLVDKWRSMESRGCPSFAQLLLLPPSFQLELHRALNRRFGFGRALLRHVLEDLGDLALMGGVR